MTEAVISGLRVYPVKSMGGIELSQAPVEKRGLKHDRRWMLVDEDGQFLTQRSDTRLALFRQTIEEGGLRIKNPSGEACPIPFEPTGCVRTVQVWKSICEAIQVSDEIDKWFSDQLDMNCSLVYMPDVFLRQTNEEYTREGDIVGFADAYPVLVIGEASLQNLNSRLETPLPMNRFRPNIIVSGTLPHEEDTWQEIVIGQTRFRAAKKCGRCSVTATDQETGAVGIEPLRTLAKYRLENQNVMFGAYFVPEFLNTISVGDCVQVQSILNA